MYHGAQDQQGAAQPFAHAPGNASTQPTRGRKRKNAAATTGSTHGNSKMQKHSQQGHMPPYGHPQHPSSAGGPRGGPANSQMPPPSNMQHFASRQLTGMGLGSLYDDVSGDFILDDLDRLTSRDIAMARYKRNHDLLALVFDTRRIDSLEPPESPYASLNQASLKARLGEAETELATLRSSHAAKVKTIKDDYAKQETRLHSFIDANSEVVTDDAVTREKGSRAQEDADYNWALRPGEGSIVGVGYVRAQTPEEVRVVLPQPSAPVLAPAEKLPEVAASAEGQSSVPAQVRPGVTTSADGLATVQAENDTDMNDAPQQVTEDTIQTHTASNSGKQDDVALNMNSIANGVIDQARSGGMGDGDEKELLDADVNADNHDELEDEDGDADADADGEADASDDADADADADADEDADGQEAPAMIAEASEHDASGSVPIIPSETCEVLQANDILMTEMDNLPTAGAETTEANSSALELNQMAAETPVDASIDTQAIDAVVPEAPTDPLATMIAADTPVTDVEPSETPVDPIASMITSDTQTSEPVIPNAPAEIFPDILTTASNTNVELAQEEALAAAEAPQSATIAEDLAAVQEGSADALPYAQPSDPPIVAEDPSTLQAGGADAPSSAPPSESPIAADDLIAAQPDVEEAAAPEPVFDTPAPAEDLATSQMTSAGDPSPAQFSDPPLIAEDTGIAQQASSTDPVISEDLNSEA